MGIVVNPEDPHTIELARWNKAYQFEPFPQMVYKAWPRDNGRVECGDPLVAVGDVAAAAFTKRCQRLVKNEMELALAHGDGWCDTPSEALEHYEASQRDIARAAAEVHASVTKMSPKAQAEHKARDAATHKHLPEG